MDISNEDIIERAKNLLAGDNCHNCYHSVLYGKDKKHYCMPEPFTDMKLYPYALRCMNWKHYGDE